MALWYCWYDAIVMIRPAFSRTATFMWFLVCVAGLSVREDNIGVTSIVRALSLKPTHYQNLLNCCHSQAINLEFLYRLWMRAVIKLFDQQLERVNGRIVLIADGKKIAKSGKKMPAVKKLHQESDDNTKPSYIMGHSTQCVGILVKAAKSWFCVPLIMRIHEGLIFSNRDKRSLLDKLLLAIAQLDLELEFYLVADAYYCSGKMIKPLVINGSHLITRAKRNCVAYYSAPECKDKRKRGRPKSYGQKVTLYDLFNSALKIEEIASPAYNEKSVTLKVRTINLMWKPLGQQVKFVLVDHPSRGKIVLMCSDLTLDTTQIIRLYCLRFKIEVGFKQASQVIGSYGYHFWMSDMKPTKRFEGNRHLHMETERYRNAVKRKVHAYHVFLMMGVISQGLMQFLSVRYPEEVWSAFRSWLRTIRNGVAPSELVVSMALRHSLGEFLIGGSDKHELTKFILARQVTDYKIDFANAA